MDYLQLGRVLSVSQALTYGARGLDVLAPAVFSALRARNADAADILDDAVAGAEWRRLELVKHMLEFLVTFAQDSTPTLAQTFTQPPWRERVKEYAFLGVSAKMFDAFVDAWLDALRNTLDADDVSEDSLAAWRFLLTLCVEQISRQLPARAEQRRGSDADAKARSPATSQRRTLVKTPTVNEKLRDRAPSLTGGNAPLAKTSPGPPERASDSAPKRRGSTAPRIDASTSSATTASASSTSAERKPKVKS